jgi:hypothetical protein
MDIRNSALVHFLMDATLGLRIKLYEPRDRTELHAPLNLREKLHIVSGLRMKPHATLALMIKRHATPGPRIKPQAPLISE